MFQAAVDVGHRHRAHARCGQFQRQRNAFEPGHQFAHRGRFFRRKLEVAAVLLRAVHEQAHGSGARQRLKAVLPARYRQRLDRVQTLARHAQRLPATGHEGDLRRGLEDRMREQCDRLEQVLAVVQDDQHAARLEVSAKRLQQRPTRLLAHAHGLCSLGDDQRAIAQGRQIEKPDAIGILGHQLGGHLQAQPGLAQAAHAQQREQSGLGQQPLELGQFPLASKEGCKLLRQVIGDLAHRQPALAHPHDSVDLLAIGRRREGGRVFADLEKFDWLRDTLEHPMAMREGLQRAALQPVAQRRVGVGRQQRLGAARQ